MEGRDGATSSPSGEGLTASKKEEVDDHMSDNARAGAKFAPPSVRSTMRHPWVTRASMRCMRVDRFSVPSSFLSPLIRSIRCIALYPRSGPPRNTALSSSASRGAAFALRSHSFPSAFRESTSSSGIDPPPSFTSSLRLPSGSNARSSSLRSISFTLAGTPLATKSNGCPGFHNPNSTASSTVSNAAPGMRSPDDLSTRWRPSNSPHAPKSSSAVPSSDAPPVAICNPFCLSAALTASLAVISIAYNLYTDFNSSGKSFRVVLGGNRLSATLANAVYIRRLSGPVSNDFPAMPNE
mmetsp:Transcript_21534/g.63089  ORF Transcript_21534/g.63089 Transcript_21534/m.63089 type:complete len:295 (+) Transcript_21534:1193-2077(+)